MAEITQQQLAPLAEQLRKIQEQAAQMFKGIEEKGITSNTGRVLLAPGQFSASQLIDSPGLRIPDISVPPTIKDALGSISSQGISAAASASSMDEFFKAQQGLLMEQQKQLATAKEQQKGILQTLTDFFAGRQKQTDIMQQQMEKFGIPEGFKQIQALIPEIQTLNLKFAELEQSEAREVAGIQENPNYSLQFASRESNRVAREYAIRKSGIAAEVGAKTATMQALQGNITMARGLISDVVSAMQADDQMKLAGIQMFYNINQDFISGLERKEQALLTDIRDYWENKVTEDRQDYEMKLNLLTDAAGKGVNLGLSASQIKSMSLEEMSELYTKQVGPAVAAEKGKGSIVDIRNQQEAFAGELLAIQKLGDRQKALDYLNLNSAYLKVVMGNTNYQQLFTEVDRLYPIPAPLLPVQPTISPEAFAAGQKAKQGVKATKQFFTEPFIETIGKPALKVEDFFKGLFGR